MRTAGEECLLGGRHAEGRARSWRCSPATSAEATEAAPRGSWRSACSAAPGTPRPRPWNPTWAGSRASRRGWSDSPPRGGAARVRAGPASGRNLLADRAAAPPAVRGDGPGCGGDDVRGGAPWWGTQPWRTRVRPGAAGRRRPGPPGGKPSRQPHGGRPRMRAPPERRAARLRSSFSPDSRHLLRVLKHPDESSYPGRPDAVPAREPGCGAQGAHHATAGSGFLASPRGLRKYPRIPPKLWARTRASATRGRARGSGYTR